MAFAFMSGVFTRLWYNYYNENLLPVLTGDRRPRTRYLSSVSGPLSPVYL
jgi:hypothetical protein